MRAGDAALRTEIQAVDMSLRQEMREDSRAINQNLIYLASSLKPYIKQAATRHDNQLLEV